MNPPGGDELDARLDALATRIDDALIRAQTRMADDRARVHGRDDDIERLRAKLERAEASANLQAQRCQALEDHIIELEAALVGARDHRARAEAQAESAKREADAALDELERLRSSNGRTHAPNLDLGLGEALQTKLLEIERLTRERDGLRTNCDELRGRNRELRRERDESTLALERIRSQVEELRERDTTSRTKLGEFERVVDELRRELEIAERRAKHMRAHLGVR